MFWSNWFRQPEAPKGITADQLERLLGAAGLTLDGIVSEADKRIKALSTDGQEKLATAKTDHDAAEAEYYRIVSQAEQARNAAVGKADTLAASGRQQIREAQELMVIVNKIAN